MSGARNKWRAALANGWKVMRRWFRRDADLTQRARQIDAALKSAIRRRRAA